MSGVLLCAVTFALLLVFSPLVGGQYNGTDAFPPTQQSSCVYTSTRVYSVPAPLQFTPATPALTPSDDGYDIVSLGFSFNFYGVTYSSAVISSNANLQFTTYSTNFVPTGLPQGDQSLSPFIALFYTDLYPVVAGMKTFARLGVAPYRSFIVRYFSVPYFGTRAGNLTADLIIYETSNTIEMRYYSASTDSGGHAVVIGVDGAGVQVATGGFDYLAILNGVTLNQAQASQLSGFSLVISTQSPLAANPFACFAPAASAYTGGGAVAVSSSCTNPGDLALSLSTTLLTSQQSAGINVSLPSGISFISALPCFSNGQSDALLLLSTRNQTWSGAAFNSTAVQKAAFVQFLLSSIPPLCKWGSSVVQGSYILAPGGGLLAPAAALLNCPTPPYLSPSRVYQLDVSFDYGASFFATVGSVTIRQPAVSQATRVGTTLIQSVPQIYLPDGSVNLTWTTSSFGAGVAVDVLVYGALPFLTPLQPKYRAQINSASAQVQVFTSYTGVVAALAHGVVNTGFLHLSAAAVTAAWPGAASQLLTSFIAFVPHSNSTLGSRRLLSLLDVGFIYDILSGLNVPVIPPGTWSYGPGGTQVAPFGTTNPWQFAINYILWQQILDTCYGAYCGVQNNCFGYDGGVAVTDSLDQACFRHDACYNCGAGIDTDTNCAAAGYSQQQAVTGQQCDCDLVSSAGASSTCTDDAFFSRIYCDYFALKVQAYFGSLILYRQIAGTGGDCNPPPTPTPPTTPGSASSGGDVHFHTLDQCYYTFMGVGDFTLYTDSMGFNAQIRMLPVTNLFPGATITTGLCMQQGAPLTVSPRVCVYANASFPLIRVDGLLTFIPTSGSSWCTSTFCLTRTTSTVTVTFASGYVMNIQASIADTLWSWTFTVPPAAFNSSVGLLGRWDHSLSGDLIPGPATPPGAYPALTAPLNCLGTNPSGTVQDLYGFGYSWLVQFSDNSSLFDFPFKVDAGAVSPVIPPATTLPPFATPVAQAAAVAACGYLNGTQFLFDCQYDAALLSFSNTTVNSTGAFNAILQAVVTSDLTTQQAALLAAWTVPTPSITFAFSSMSPTLTGVGSGTSTSVTSLYSATVLLAAPTAASTSALIGGTQLSLNSTRLQFDVDRMTFNSSGWMNVYTGVTNLTLTFRSLSAASTLSLRVRTRLSSLTSSNGTTLFTSLYTAVAGTVPGCAPVCTASTAPCGPDGCGAVCGSCAAGLYCSNANTCQATQLVPLATLVNSTNSSAVLPSSSSSTGGRVIPPSVTSASSSSSLSTLSSASTAGGGRVVGDPLLVGFLGQRFQVHGVAGSVYNLISDPSVTVNALFVFLSQGACPPTSLSQPKPVCWSHPGSYLGQLGFHTRHGSRLLLASGPASSGFSVVQIDGRSLKVGHREVVDGLTVFKESNYSVKVTVGPFSISLSNSDWFVNLDEVQIVAGSEELRSHGLLGQTWRVPLTPGLDVKEVEGRIDDYAESGDDLFGRAFVYQA